MHQLSHVVFFDIFFNRFCHDSCIYIDVRRDPSRHSAEAEMKESVAYKGWLNLADDSSRFPR